MTWIAPSERGFEQLADTNAARGFPPCARVDDVNPSQTLIDALRSVTIEGEYCEQFRFSAAA